MKIRGLKLKTAGMKSLPRRMSFYERKCLKKFFSVDCLKLNKLKMQA